MSNCTDHNEITMFKVRVVTYSIPLGVMRIFSSSVAGSFDSGGTMDSPRIFGFFCDAEDPVSWSRDAVPSPRDSGASSRDDVSSPPTSPEAEGMSEDTSSPPRARPAPRARPPAPRARPPAPRARPPPRPLEGGASAPAPRPEPPGSPPPSRYREFGIGALPLLVAFLAVNTFSKEPDDSLPLLILLNHLH